MEFTKLKELAAAHSRFSAPVNSVPDSFEEIYRELLSHRKNMSDFDKKYYMFTVTHAEELCQTFVEAAPESNVILHLMNDLHATYHKYDGRDEDLCIYSPDVVLLVILLAAISGCTNCRQYADFWFQHNPILQYVIPGMPEPKHMISAETVRFFMKLIPKDAFEELFRKHFSGVKLLAEDLFQEQDKETGEYRRTIGGDGQEVRASYRQGEASRAKKGAIGVVAYDCDNRVVLDYTSVQLKNHEIEAFTTMLDRMAITDDAIFYADALNTQDSFIEYLNGKDIDWFFPVKSNLKTRHEALEQAFSTIPDDEKYFKRQETRKSGGRIEEYTYEILPASAATSVSPLFERVGSIMKVTKVTARYIKNEKSDVKRRPSRSVIYYVSSLEFGEKNFDQLIHSLNVRWRYEQHHNTLDVVMLQDTHAMCDEQHLSTMIGLNKCVYNVVSFARQRMTEQGFDHIKHRKTTKTRRPISYQRTFDHLASNPLMALNYLLEYFMTEPVPIPPKQDK